MIQLAVIGLILIAIAMGRAAMQSDDIIAQVRAALTALFAVIAVIGIGRGQPWARVFIAAASLMIWTQLFYPAPTEEMSTGTRVIVTVLISALLLLINMDIWTRLGRSTAARSSPRRPGSTV